MIGLSFGLAALICRFLGNAGDAMMLAVGGAISIPIDLIYRSYSPLGHWINPNGGGKFFFLPIWIFGVFWTCYGVWKVRSNIP